MPAFPLLQFWFGYYSRLSAPKYGWLNIGEGEGAHLSEYKSVKSEYEILEKIQEKRCLFH